LHVEWKTKKRTYKKYSHKESLAETKHTRNIIEFKEIDSFDLASIKEVESLELKGDKLTASNDSQTITFSEQRSETTNHNKHKILEQKELVYKPAPNESNNVVIEPFSLTSFILGIIGWFVPYVGLLMVILALVFGAIGLSRFANNPNQYKGKGFAITGLILGILGTAILLIALVLASSNM